MVSVHELRNVIAAQRPRLLSRLRELVELESPSEHPPGINHAVDVVAAWARALGAAVLRHPQAAFGDVLELRFNPATPGSSRSSRPILLLGHLDTVWPLGTLATMPWREADGKLFGPGVLDMKAGVIMAIEALSALRALQAHRPVTLLLNSEEEVGSPVSRPLTEALATQSSAVFVLEPAQGLAYKTARKGVGQFHLAVDGVAAHAGVDFESGHSAILEMARLVEQISGFTDLPRGITVTVGVIHGGTRSNVVPAHCTAEIDVRIAHPEDAGRLDRLFRSLQATDPLCTITVSGGLNRPPMERTSGTVRLYQQARAFAGQLGLDLPEAPTGGGSDGNFTAALGVPTLDGMGAVGSGAHAAHEHVIAGHLVDRTAILAAMIASAD